MSRTNLVDRAIGCILTDTPLSEGERIALLAYIEALETGHDRLRAQNDRWRKMMSEVEEKLTDAMAGW